MEGREALRGDAVAERCPGALVLNLGAAGAVVRNLEQEARPCRRPTSSRTWSSAASSRTSGGRFRKNLGLAILHKLLAALPGFCAAVSAARVQAPGRRARAKAGKQGRESLWSRDPW